MSTDALSRRLRFAPPNQRVSRLVLTEADYCIFEALARHGPLPTHYLYEFQKHLRKRYGHVQGRLTELYNGDKDGPYLTRPPRQFDGYEARYQHVVYDLGSRARRVLRERGVTPPSRQRTDPFLHQLMQACVTSSLELSTAWAGLRYISRAEILAHPRLSPEARAAADPLAIPLKGFSDQKVLVPDDLFGIQYPGGYRFFALEVDRNTESIERRHLEHKSFGRKVLAYLEIMRARRYQSWWGLPNFHVLTVTTNATHAANLLDFVERQDPGVFGPFFAFAVAPEFGAPWRVPKTVLTRLLDEPWTTIAGPKDLTKP